MTAGEALSEFLQHKFKTVLEIGPGEAGEHTKILRKNGKEVTTVDTQHPADITGDFVECGNIGVFDAVWCSHVLEHQRNTGDFLDKIHQALAEGGVLGITVPPISGRLAGGHVSMWTTGLLVYNLVLAGFDCSDARIWKYGYNISAVLKKRAIKLPELTYSNGDIEKLAKYFPVKAYQHMGDSFQS